MQSLSPIIVPDNALRALQQWLWDHRYDSQHAVDAIVDYTSREGTPTGSPYLDPEDEAAATEAFVAAMPSEPYCSHEWGPPDGALLPPDLDPDAYPSEGDELFAAAPFADDQAGPLPELPDLRDPADWPPPVAGGAPSVPSAEDRAEYRAWSERLERLSDVAEAGRVADDPRYGYE